MVENKNTMQFPEMLMELRNIVVAGGTLLGELSSYVQWLLMSSLSFGGFLFFIFFASLSLSVKWVG